MNENLKDWFEQKQKPVTTPSGLQVTIKRVSVQELAARGEIPIPLVAEWNKLLETIGEERTTEQDVKDLGTQEALYECVLGAAMLSPKLGLTTDIENNIIGFVDLLALDKAFLFGEITKGIRLLDPFRKQTDTTESTSSNG